MKFAVLFACVAFAAPAIAQQATPTPAPATADAKPEKKICKMIDTTGSIMGKRECHTRDEWRQISAANAEQTERTLGNRPRGGTGSMGGN
ncbi:hypothetical protein HZY97_08950 [Sphingomonas sp. R-74633]|uniref:hypothetical protein n=1 Tax=Sphingomonas sp. R-74633 TaxID=2751188 RepID=UPI0015D36E15|nr:hypothetical protein [Sphingomonas sp. R-74633]NYT40880.1 hypothetical protein [Sphingomonas sp. R-74633]